MCFSIRNYYLHRWKSRNRDATYLQFFNWLKSSGASIVQSAYDVWRNQCHILLSQDQDLAILNEVYEIFLKLEFDVLESFENSLKVLDLVETIRVTCNFPDHIFSTLQTCYSISDIFYCLQKYWSFCSYQLLRNLIEIYGTDEDKEKLEYYRRILFDRVYKCQIARFPLNIYGNLYLATEKIEDLTITVELDKELIAVGNIQHIHIKFAELFDVHPCQLHLLRVSGNDSREYNLHFLICSWIAEDFLNVPKTAESTFEEIHIVNFSVGQYYEV